MKIISPPQSGRVGDVVYVMTRYGQIVRKYVPPRNPRTQRQQQNRGAFGAVSSQWRGLTPQEREAWRLAAASSYTISHSGQRVSLNGYNYFVRVNASRASMGLSLFRLPPTVPSFSPNPVAELAVTNTGGDIRLKLRVPTQPAQYTLVQGAAPVSVGVSCVQHFVYLGMLPSAEAGYSDITELYVARYGRPTVGSAVYIRTCQHIDGWTDVPREVSAVVPAQ